MPFIPTLDLNCPNPDYYQLANAHTHLHVCVHIHNNVDDKHKISWKNPWQSS